MQCESSQLQLVPIAQNFTCLTHLNTHTSPVSPTCSPSPAPPSMLGAAPPRPEQRTPQSAALLSRILIKCSVSPQLKHLTCFDEANRTQSTDVQVLITVVEDHIKLPAMGHDMLEKGGLTPRHNLPHRRDDLAVAG